MTSAGSRSDRNGKAEPAPPEILDKDDCEWFCIQGRHWIPIDYDPAADAYRSWELAIDALHDRMIAELVADHDNRMPGVYLTGRPGLPALCFEWVERP